ncbi:MAG TPA: helix-turn-helix domain-containing protein [Marinagarivorans sp.]
MLELTSRPNPKVQPSQNVANAAKRLSIPTSGLSLKSFSDYPRFCQVTVAQLTPGSFSGNRQALVASSISGLCTTANQKYLQQVTVLCPSKLVFGFSNSEQALFFNGRQMTPNDIFVLHSHNTYDMVVAKNASLFVICLDSADNSTQNDQTTDTPINALIAQIKSTLAQNDSPFLTHSQPRLRDQLAAHLLCTQGAGASEPPLAPALQLLKASQSASYRPNSRNNLLSRTLRLMQSQPFHFRKISEVAEACHVSQRGLEKAFHGALCSSPGEYLKAIQLNRYRMAVVDHAANVKLSLADIATQVGAVNYSRLSKDYKTFFGELPSLTRKRISANITS